MGSYLHPLMVKMKILEDYAEFDSFCQGSINTSSAKLDAPG